MSAPAIDQESAVLDFLLLARLTNPSMTGSPNDLEFLGCSELDYTDNLRRVQRNLHEVPHVKQEPSCAIEAVRGVSHRVGPTVPASLPLKPSRGQGLIGVGVLEGRF